MYGKGISRDGEIVDMGVEFEILRRSGAWFYYGETRLGQGRDNVKQLIRENKALADELEAKIMEKYNERMNGKKGEDAQEDMRPVIIPEQAEPVRPRKKIDIDIAVDD